MNRCLREGGRRPAFLLLLSAAAWALALPACERRSAVQLSHTFDSAEAAAHAVLDALARRDAAALRQLPLDAHEFRTVVWPELPASRPEANLPVDYVWGSLHQTSAGNMVQILSEHGGRRYQLAEVRFRGETTRYASFSIHRKVELIVGDATGDTRRVRLFGSLLERSGRWKVVSFVID